jgi:hypothetical protein
MKKQKRVSGLKDFVRSREAVHLTRAVGEVCVVNACLEGFVIVEVLEESNRLVQEVRNPELDFE